MSEAATRCAFCDGPIVRPVVKGGSVFCSPPCSRSRVPLALPLSFDNPKAEIGAFDRPPGVAAMKDRIAEIYSPPSNVSIAEPSPAVRVRLRSSLRELAALDRAQALELRGIVVELLAAKDGGDWPKVTTQAIELARIANGLDLLADETEEKAAR